MMQAMKWVAALALGVATSVALAQGNGDVSVVLEQHKVIVAADGKEIREEAKSSRPGDLIEYVASYRNTGKSTARGLLGVLPVPDGMSYAGSNSGPQPMQASLDGKKYEVPPLKRVVRQADGSTKTETVPPGEYRSLRWNLGDLPAGQRVQVSARMRLNPVSTAGSPVEKR